MTMGNVLAAFVVAASFAIAAPAFADSSADFSAGADANKTGKYDLAIGLYTRVIRAGDTDNKTMAAAHYNRALAYEKLNEKEKALADYEVFAQLDPSDVDGPTKVVELAIALKRTDSARKALTTWLERFPDDAKKKPFSFVQVARADQLEGRWQAADDLLTRYAKLDPASKIVALPRARTAASLGRSAEAIELLKSVGNQYGFIVARADRSFEKLWNDAAFVAATDVPRVLERGLIEADEEMEKAPNKLTSIVSRMQALRRVGRMAEAIELGNRTVAGAIDRFEDRDTMLVWVYDELARNHKVSGDMATAEKAYRAGIERVGEQNRQVVNIIINAAEFLAKEAGKYREAIEMAERATKVGASAYGDQFVRGTLAAAHWGLKQQAEFDRLVAKIEANATDNPTQAIDTLLLAGRRDDAARIVAGMLADPRWVDSTLLDLQRYAKKRPPTGAAAKAIDAGWEAIRAHPTVTAALVKVGRITTVPATGQY